MSNEGKMEEGNDNRRVWLKSPVYIRGTHQPKDYVCVGLGELEWSPIILSFKYLENIKLEILTKKEIA